MEAKNIEELAAHLSAFETFVKRRFDEISMEINATSQQLDHAGRDIEGQFKEIMGTLSAISFSGDGRSQVNAGVELDAVIQDTENAANSIMDAADRIAVRLREQNVMDDKLKREETLKEIRGEVQNILLACTFQDLTSQRIRKAVENIQGIQTRLGTALEKLGIHAEVTGQEVVEKANATRLHSQSDIDALFG